jgi:hypothetical protein
MRHTILNCKSLNCKRLSMAIRVPYRQAMRFLCLGACFFATLLGAAALKVESISLTGAENYRLSQPLLDRIQKLIGAELQPDAMEQLAGDIRNELGSRAVTHKVTPGDQPDHVKVVLEVTPSGDAPAPAPEPEAADVNVNSRYLVEGIDVRGGGRLSDELNDDIQRRIGRQFNQNAMDDLARRIRRELRARTVVTKVLRGTQAERVKVVFEVVTRREEESDLHLTKFVYHSKQAWTAKVFGDFDIGRHAGLVVGIASDADDLLERYAGVGAGFEVRKVGTERIRLRFLFESYHHQWNNATLEALDPARLALRANDVPGIYRTRHSFQPALTVVLADPLTLTVGASFHHLQLQYPDAHRQAADAAVAGLRYRQRFRSPGGEQHEVRAGYDLHAGTGVLDSDFIYARHLWNAGYKIGGSGHAVVAKFMGGRLSGRAPLLERFTLGNSTTLRGWSKFDVAPVGGDRVAYGSLEYRHRLDGGTHLIAFYDVGSVWDRGLSAEAKHAVGFGLRTWRFQMALGFPVRSGRMEPMFSAGVYFTEDADF